MSFTDWRTLFVSACIDHCASADVGNVLLRTIWREGHSPDAAVDMVRYH